MTFTVCVCMCSSEKSSKMRAQNDFYWTERVKPLIAVRSGTEREG